MDKKFLSLSVIITSLSLTGCMITGTGAGGASNKTSSEGSSQTTNSSTEQAKQPIEIIEEKDLVNDIRRDANNNIIYDNVTINLWSTVTGTKQSGGDGGMQQELVEAFNELYEGQIKVTISSYSRYDFASVLESALTYGTGNPDALFTHSNWLYYYLYRDWVAPIEDYYTLSNTSLMKNDINESLLESTSYGNKMIATPIDCHSAMIEIRTDILEKNGLTIPTNYEELCTVCDTLSQLGKEGNLWIRGPKGSAVATEWRKTTAGNPYYPFAFGYSDMWVHEFAGYTAAVQNGGNLVDKVSGYPLWNSDEVANGLNVMKDFMFPTSSSKNKFAFTSDYGTAVDVANTPFLHGDCVFKFLGPWSLSSDISNFDSYFSADGGSNNIATRSMSSMFAKNPNAPYANKIKGEGHAIYELKRNKSLTKRSAIAVFADYMAYYSGVEWAKYGHLPAFKSVMEDESYTGDEFYQKYIKYWGNPSDYITCSGSVYFSDVDSGFKSVLQKSLSTAEKDKDVRSLLSSYYKDTIDSIKQNYEQ